MPFYSKTYVSWFLVLVYEKKLQAHFVPPMNSKRRILRMTQILEGKTQKIILQSSCWLIINITLKSLIEEHARLDFSDFLSTLFAIFPPARLLIYLVKKKFHPARLSIYLVIKQAGWHFFPSLLVYSGLLLYQGLQSSQTIHFDYLEFFIVFDCKNLATRIKHF